VITVRELVGLDGLGLELVAGTAGADREIRWVASTEIADPRPFLRGGEVLLTTGLAFGHDAEGYVERLAGAGLAGLGFAVGIHLPELPPAVAAAAERRGFPVFLVPYETPFVAITEAAMTRIVHEQYAQLARAVELHDRLVSLVLEEAGLEAIAAEAAAAIDGRIRVLAHDGRVLATAGQTVPDADAIVLDVGVHAPGEAVLEATLGRAFTDWDRMQLQQARTVVALELAKRRAVAETERRIAGDLVEDAVSGTGDVRQLARRLAAFGLETEAGVAVILLRPGDADATSLAALHRRTADAVAGSGLAGLVGGEVCVLIATPDADAAEAEAARLATTARNGGPAPSVSVSHTRPMTALRDAYDEAFYALEARLAAGDRGVATARDLGSLGLVLALQDPRGVELFVRSALGDLDGRLLETLAAFIEANGRAGDAAERLGVHRHTMRHRLRRIEASTGRDLTSARDRLELWLALKAREVATRRATTAR
jgi:PucR family transcriptional regulator, purine catabolism regulatory protein